MKAFVAVLSLLAAASADQSSHQSFSLGGHSHRHGVSAPHGHAAAPVHAAPEEPASEAPVYEETTTTTTAAPTYKPAPTYAPYRPRYQPTYKPEPSYHPAPAYKPEPSYHPAPAYKPSYKEPEYEEPAKYVYNYAVKDDYSGVDFTQDENRDGYATSGSYRVALPDGRTQIVTYTVNDGYSGYVADVTYEGEAQYPEYKPTYKPAYEPKPAYQPAPSYSA